MGLLLVCVLHFLLYFLCVSGQSGPRCDSSRANQQITDQGGLYWCSGDGRKVPVACLAPDGSRIDIGSSHWTDSSVLECRQQAADRLQLSTVACLKNGRRVQLGQSIDDGRYFYKCSAGNSGSLKLQPTGCVGENGAYVSPGGVVNQGGFSYTCNIGSGGPAPKPAPAAPGPPAPKPVPRPQQQLTPVGCSFNGKEYKLEDDMELSGAWYKCTKDSSGAPTSTLLGCIVNGRKYRVSDTWRDEFFAFRCEPVGGFVMSNAYACVEKNPDGRIVEYAPGRKWLAGSNQFNRYVISCTKQGIQLRRRGVACYYNTNEGQGVLDGGCMKKVGSIIIRCEAPGATPNVRIRITENPSPADEQQLQASGLRFCESRPLQSVIN